MAKKDTVEQDGNWEFDEDVAESFDDMLSRSIPQYDVMRAAVNDLSMLVLGQRTAPGRPLVIDLGTSRGRAVEEIVRRTDGGADFLLCEISDPMLEAAGELYADEIASGQVRLEKRDLRTDFPSDDPAALILSVLTLQFIPINYRQRIVQQIHDALEPGGALIIVEKVLGDGPVNDEFMVELYHARKHAAGYSYDSIDRKRQALEGVLVPITARHNVDLFERAGFRAVDCFWRWMNFGAWIALK